MRNLVLKTRSLQFNQPSFSVSSVEDINRVNVEKSRSTAGLEGGSKI